MAIGHTTIFLGTLFQFPVGARVGREPISVVVGDFNADRQANLAVANYLSNNVSVLINDSLR